ncbi:cryptochrome/photolyase family protein [Mesobacterium pallidum]|uniref:cryptochrome/photolyase family protein n=1 Tax=Mesobacterium pallidum TaxID=2872037 RepID=UPI001EE1EFFE|nr:deoxyribodipyrimidine photo-lyase [Mesobacterium pallidum]
MTAPTILWLRRDLRLSDHPALSAAVDAGGPVIPVLIRDSVLKGQGAAPRWRLGLSIAAHRQVLEGKGSRLVLRSGEALGVLREMIEETGARAVYWTRLYDPESVARDTEVKAALKEDGIEAKSFGGHVLFEPWTVETQQGGPYKVYSPYWRAVKDREVEAPLPAPEKIPAPASWPESEALEDWQLGADMRRGAAVMAEHATVGEKAAQARLGGFTGQKIDAYKDKRDMVAEDGTSGLSENLTYGEITPHQCWHAGQRAREEQSGRGPETFLKELAWREFAYHLLHHFPKLATDNWRDEWDAFPWKEDQRIAEIKAWKQARTGIPLVDAALREMYVTGRMHNRARMIVASYLTKHLMVHWRVGLQWFEDCLTDWDPASNAMGWQWVAGCGPDAAPYFRIFNPETQAEKFDPDERYRRRWIAEGQRKPTETALSYFEAIPETWGMSPDDPYPKAPVVGLKAGREAALGAYERLKG